MFLLEATPSAKAGSSAWEDRVGFSGGLHSAKGNINLLNILQHRGKHLLGRHFGDWADTGLYKGPNMFEVSG